MDRSQSVWREIFANPQPVSGFELAGTRKKDKNGQGRISLELHDNLHYKRCFLLGEPALGFARICGS